jgi:ABC-type Fe3+ transport system permease subunit
MSAPTSAQAEQKPGVRQAEVRKRRHRVTVGSVVVAVLRYIALVVSAVLFLLPFLLDPAQRDLSGHRHHRSRLDAVPPKKIHWENFTELFTDPNVNIVQGLLNSAIIAVLQTTGILLLCSVAGYSLARIPYRWATPIFYATLVTPDVSASGDVHPVVHHRLPAASGRHISGDHRAGALISGFRSWMRRPSPVLDKASVRLNAVACSR